MDGWSVTSMTGETEDKMNLDLWMERVEERKEGWRE